MDGERDPYHSTETSRAKSQTTPISGDLLEGKKPSIRRARTNADLTGFARPHPHMHHLREIRGRELYRESLQPALLIANFFQLCLR